MKTVILRPGALMTLIYMSIYARDTHSRMVAGSLDVNDDPTKSKNHLQNVVWNL